ncbi:MAG: GspH/FimT family pseudopilin [Candidatus Xenobia bacterium]
MRARPRPRGWTMLEIVVSLTILSILIAMAVPLFTHQRDMRNLDTGERELAALFVYARQSAVSQGVVTQISITGVAQAITSPTSKLQILQPVVALTVPSTGVTLQTVSDIASNISLQVPLDQNSQSVTTIQFSPNGSVTTPVAFTSSGTQGTSGLFSLVCTGCGARTWSLVTTTGGVLQQQ